MATVTRLGPTDHGRPMTVEEFSTGDYEEGHRYELIDGKLYVSPAPNVPESWLELWLFGKLYLYSREHPEIINYVTPKGRVMVPGQRRVTRPEPDVTAFRDFPLDRPICSIRWQDVSPVLVVEVMAGEDTDKDSVRNVELYLRVPSIKEYWLLDARGNAERPTLLVRRRRGQRWHIIELPYGATYTTKLLPGFELVMDPRG